jgi:hypothetical protein
MIDARYEEAQRSNQSCDGGWDLFPEPSVSEFKRPSFVIVILSVVVIAAALIGAITQ